MAARDILTKRIENGWAHKDGRVRALRDRSQLEAKAAGAQYFGMRPRAYWTVQLLSPDGTQVWDEESVNTLDEADEQAWWFVERIHEGRDHPDYDPDEDA